MMPSLQDASVPPVPVNGVVNGTNGQHRPQTPTTNMALTEYSINPSTPSPEKRARIKQIVPDEYLLPTGYPDVSNISRLDVADWEETMCLTLGFFVH
jgi:threonine dehydratase